MTKLVGIKRGSEGGTRWVPREVGGDETGHVQTRKVQGVTRQWKTNSRHKIIQDTTRTRHYTFKKDSKRETRR